MRARIIVTALVILFSGLTLSARKAKNVTPKQPENVFLGAVMKKNSINAPVHKFVEVKLQKEDIIGPLYWGKSIRKTELSKENMLKIIKEKLTEHPDFKQSEALNFKIITLKGNYNKLVDALGQDANMKYYFGVEKNISFTKTALLFQIISVYFEIYIGYPVQNEDYLDKEEIERLEKAGMKKEDLVFISNIQFGRAMNMIIESGIPIPELRGAVINALRGESLSEKQKYILDNATITTMLIGEEKMPESTAGNIFERVNKYFATPVTTENFGNPIYVNFADLHKSRTYYNEY